MPRVGAVPAGVLGIQIPPSERGFSGMRGIFPQGGIGRVISPESTPQQGNPFAAQQEEMRQASRRQLAPVISPAAPRTPAFDESFALAQQRHIRSLAEEMDAEQRRRRSLRSRPGLFLVPSGAREMAHASRTRGSLIMGNPQ